MIMQCALESLLRLQAWLRVKDNGRIQERLDGRPRRERLRLHRGPGDLRNTECLELKYLKIKNTLQLFEPSSYYLVFNSLT